MLACWVCVFKSERSQLDYSDRLMFSFVLIGLFLVLSQTCSNEVKCICDRDYTGKDCSVFDPIPDPTPPANTEKKGPKLLCLSVCVCFSLSVCLSACSPRIPLIVCLPSLYLFVYIYGVLGGYSLAFPIAIALVLLWVKGQWSKVRETD